MKSRLMHPAFGYRVVMLMVLWWFGREQTKVQIDGSISRVVNTFPSVVHSPRAVKLGLPRDRSVEELIQQYVDEFFEDEYRDAGGIV